MFLSKVRKMGLAPRQNGFWRISRKVKILGHMLINNFYINIKHAYAASFKPTLKSLRPSEAKGQLRRWVNMGVAFLGFPHGKKNVFTRKSIIHTFRKVCAKFHEYLEICRYMSIND